MSRTPKITAGGSSQIKILFFADARKIRTKVAFFPFFSKDISWFENRNLGEEGGEDEDVLLFEEVYWRWFWGAAKTKDLISFYLRRSRQVLEWWELWFLCGGGPYVGIYWYCFVSHSQFPSGWDPPMCLSPNHLLTSAVQSHSGVGSSRIFATVVILLLPLHKKLSIPPQVFEQSLFLF